MMMTFSNVILICIIDISLYTGCGLNIPLEDTPLTAQRKPSIPMFLLKLDGTT
jgi:hypothetical protein